MWRLFACFARDSRRRERQTFVGHRLGQSSWLIGTAHGRRFFSHPRIFAEAHDKIRFGFGSWAPPSITHRGGISGHVLTSAYERVSCGACNGGIPRTKIHDTYTKCAFNADVSSKKVMGRHVSEIRCGQKKKATDLAQRAVRRP